MLGEIIEEIIGENKEIEVVKINVDEHQELAQQYGVMSIPLVMLYNKDKIEQKHVGLMEKEELLEWVK
jgi:thioredoxin 1